jgi:Ca2+-binding RTX toxin-like protein
VLALLSLLGALVAGVAADAVLFARDKDANDGDDGDDVSPEDDAVLEDGNILDDISGDPGVPTSDDVPDPVDAAVTLTGGTGSDLMSGGSGADMIQGDAGGDLIDGRGGDDAIDAGSGNDAVWGGGGNDTLYGQDGQDTLQGQDGDDLLYGGAGADSITGGQGDDSLFGGADHDTLIGGTGNDLVEGGSGNDWLAGGIGDDTLDGGQGSDVLDGGAGDDWLSGLHGTVDDFETDYLNADAGNDTLVLGSGDLATGGDGDDTFVLHDWLSENNLAQISDYDPGQDNLVIVYDPAVHHSPTITVEPDPQSGTQKIYLDGRQLAVVSGGQLNAGDIRLVPA